MTGLRAGVPMELEFIVGKCLAKDIANRYGNAGEVAKDLRTLAEKLKSGRSMVMQADPRGGCKPQRPSPWSHPPALLKVSYNNRVRRASCKSCSVSRRSRFSLYCSSTYTESPPEKAVRRFSLAPPRLDTSDTGGWRRPLPRTDGT